MVLISFKTIEELYKHFKGPGRDKSNLKADIAEWAGSSLLIGYLIHGILKGFLTPSKRNDGYKEDLAKNRFDYRKDTG